MSHHIITSECRPYRQCGLADMLQAQIWPEFVTTTLTKGKGKLCRAVLYYTFCNLAENKLVKKGLDTALCILFCVVPGGSQEPYSRFK